MPFNSEKCYGCFFLQMIHKVINHFFLQNCNFFNLLNDFFPVKKEYEEEESSLKSKEKIALKRWMKLQKMSQAHALFTFLMKIKWRLLRSLRQIFSM